MKKCLLQSKRRRGFRLSIMMKGKRKKMTKGRADNNDEKYNEDRARNVPTVPAHTDTFEISGRDDLRDELLPGIPNDIAWQIIVPKLSGTDINTLSLVNKSWQEAIHHRWVHDARVRFHSTETFAVVRFYGEVQTNRDFRLYSLNGNYAYDLPSHERIAERCTLIPLDGKIYILGGAIPGETSCTDWRREMFMLDLAGHKEWKQCASMQEGRDYFSAGVLDGKIYVVGGRNYGQPVYKCEVYNPKVDAWSSIADLIPLRIVDRVAGMGGELFAYGGKEWVGLPLHYSRDVVAYNPVKNEWRQLGHFNGDEDHNPWVNAFMAQGKFHTISFDGIKVYDMDANSWNYLQPCLQRVCFAMETWALDDEIVTQNCDDLNCTGHGFCFSLAGIRLVQSKGFGSKNRELAYKPLGNQRLNSDIERLRLTCCNYELCLIQL